MPSCVLELSQLRVLRASNIASLPEDLGDRLQLLEVWPSTTTHSKVCRLPCTSLHTWKSHYPWKQNRGNLRGRGTAHGAENDQAASNRLRLIPEALGGLAQLEELYLNSNQIAEVPASLIGLVSIKKISLANNRISALPQVLEEKWNLDGAPANGPADAVGEGEPAIVAELFGNPIGNVAADEVSLVRKMSR